MVDIFAIWEEIEAEDIAKAKASAMAKAEAEQNNPNAEYSPEPTEIPKKEGVTEIGDIQPDVQPTQQLGATVDGGNTATEQ